MLRHSISRPILACNRSCTRLSYPYAASPLFNIQSAKFQRLSDFTEEQLNKILEKKMPPGYGQPGQVLPINVKKDGQDPVIFPDSELPEWVFDAIKPDKSLQQLEDQVATQGLNSLTAHEKKRLNKMRRRHKIKNNNYEREIGLVLSK